MSTSHLSMPATREFRNGNKAPLAFARMEYDQRLAHLRAAMDARDITCVVFTSMHNVGYYTGFLYCSFGRPYGCVITADDCFTVSANFDGGQPWRRSYGENLVYTDWSRDNFWSAVSQSIAPASRVGIEFDHLPLASHHKLLKLTSQAEFVDIAAIAMAQRIIKSPAEIELISAGAEVADLGGYAVRDAIRESQSEYTIARAGTQAMEAEIARRYPDSELRDSWTWFQSGLNTDGAHNPLTTRKLRRGDILSLNTFPMISGYYTALERTVFLGEPDFASRRIWAANVAAHELGCSLIRPGVRCSDICAQINQLLTECGLLQYRAFGYGHSFGLLSHYYGREAAVELREDVHTVLQPGLVASMEPMLTIPQGQAGAGGYREHDILVVGEAGATNITSFPYGPEHNIVEP